MQAAETLHGPYHVVCVVENGIEVRPVDHTHATPTRVSLNRVRRCPNEMFDVFWPWKDALSQSTDPTINSREEPEPLMQQSLQQSP